MFEPGNFLETALGKELTGIGMTEDQFAMRFSDVFILPNPDQAALFMKTIKKHSQSAYWTMANVKGHEWYGKAFIEIPLYNMWL